MSLEIWSALVVPLFRWSQRVEVSHFLPTSKKFFLLFFPLIKTVTVQHLSVPLVVTLFEAFPDHFVTKLLPGPLLHRLPITSWLWLFGAPIGKVVPQRALVLVLLKLQGTQLIFYFTWVFRKRHAHFMVQPGLYSDERFPPYCDQI